MQIIGTILVAIVALEHLYFLYLEMFLWTKPTGRRIFGTTKEEAETSKVLAANQGLYNGFLAAGLLWGLIQPNADFAVQIQSFFLLCVIVAGIYGGLTVNRRIFLVQGLPAFFALVAVLVLG